MRITIIGLGLIGGSIGLALKKNNHEGITITGYAHRPELGNLALKIGAVDDYETDIRSAVNKADIVFISTPIAIIKDIFIKISPYLPSGCIVTDTASTKIVIMQWAKECLSKQINFIGGHPMAGKEISGIEASDASLFRGCAYCIVRSQYCTEQSLDTFSGLTRDLGAYPKILEAEEHDELVAGISHLPYLLSVALVEVTTMNPKWNKMSGLASSGYRDMSRLAAGNPDINYDLCLTNKNAIVAWLDSYSQELEKMRSLILDDTANLYERLNNARKMREEWQANRYSEK